MKAIIKMKIVVPIGRRNVEMPLVERTVISTAPITTPRIMPVTAPINEVMTLSHVTDSHACPLVMPTARSKPISRRRSKTDSKRVMTMPTMAMMMVLGYRDTMTEDTG